MILFDEIHYTDTKGLCNPVKDEDTYSFVTLSSDLAIPQSVCSSVGDIGFARQLGSVSDALLLCYLPHSQTNHDRLRKPSQDKTILSYAYIVS